MTRLPINLLLYLAILGLLGGSGWHFYQALVVEAKTDAQNNAEQEANRDRFVKLLERGAAGAGKIAVGPSYGERTEFWDALATANFNGEEPPPPPPEPGLGDTEIKPVETPKTPLEDIFLLTAVLSGGQDSRIVIRYKPTANVEPPDEFATAGGAGLDAVAGAVTRTPRLPTYGTDLVPAHHMVLEDTLWKPYDTIRLVRVEPSHAVFVREDAKKPKEEWKEEKIYPEALELPQDILAKLDEGLGVRSTPNESRDGGSSTGPAQASGWQPMDETTEIGADRFNIGNRDDQMFRNDPERVFNEDVGTADWRSARGTMRGVRITRLAPGYERYGLREGEIVIAINDQPVGSKTEAIRIGRRLYDRGVRTFEVQFLTPSGQNVTRSYVAKDDR